MALYGFHIPHSKKPSDAERRRKVFDIIAPYCLSKSDMREFQMYEESIVEIWLQTFSNSQNTMIKSKLLINTKDWFRKFFPPDGAAPVHSLGKRIGLPSGRSILERYIHNE
jgi:hypothetical protein